MAKPDKRCYYEVLGISLNATDDEIRSTFRRLALRIHPDKQAANGVPITEATAAFQDLLQAYEVLSDPKERSWYDSHRSQILSSNPKSVVPSRSSYFSRHSNLNLERFFSPSCFSGFSDTGKGFFKVYGDVFHLIHSQELYFAQKLGLGLDPPSPIGNVYSPYSEFMAFYDYWLWFSTVIDFDWVYDQEEAKNDRNLMVRELVVLVRKLDKRIIDMKGKESEQDEKLREKKRLKKKEKAMRKKEEKKFGMNNMNQDQNIDDDEEEEETKNMKEEDEEAESWYNTLSAHQKRFVDNLRKKRNTKFRTEKLQALIKEMGKKQEEKKKKFERMKANKENDIYDDDEEKKERGNRRSEGAEFDSKNNNDNVSRKKKMMMTCCHMNGSMMCHMDMDGKTMRQRNEIDTDEEKKNEQKGKIEEGIYCMECNKYYSKFHTHLKSSAESSKRGKRINSGKWDASKPLITNLAPLVQEMRPWQRTLLRRGHSRVPN